MHRDTPNYLMLFSLLSHLKDVPDVRLHKDVRFSIIVRDSSMAIEQMKPPPAISKRIQKFSKNYRFNGKNIAKNK